MSDDAFPLRAIWMSEPSVSADDVMSAVERGLIRGPGRPSAGTTNPHRRSHRGRASDPRADLGHRVWRDAADSRRVRVDGSGMRAPHRRRVGLSGMVTPGPARTSRRPLAAAKDCIHAGASNPADENRPAMVVTGIHRGGTHRCLAVPASKHVPAPSPCASSRWPPGSLPHYVRVHFCEVQ